MDEVSSLANGIIPEGQYVCQCRQGLDSPANHHSDSCLGGWSSWTVRQHRDCIPP